MHALPGDDVPVRKLRNLGLASSRWLAAVGIHTRGDLARIGAAAAYRMVKQTTDAPNLNFLYALHGALLGRSLVQFSPQTKARLRREAGLE